MEDSKMGESSHDGQDLEIEGLSGIRLSIEDRNLKVDGRATYFCNGKGTQKEPLIPMPTVYLRDTLENARDIAKFLEEFNLQRIIYLNHNGWLLGIDSGAHVQLVRDKELSENESNNGIAFIEDILDTLRASEKVPQDSDKWRLSVVNPK